MLGASGHSQWPLRFGRKHSDGQSIPAYSVLQSSIGSRKVPNFHQFPNDVRSIPFAAHVFWYDFFIFLMLAKCWEDENEPSSFPLDLLQGASRCVAS